MANWAKSIAAAAIVGIAIAAAAYYYTAETFIVFVTAWLFFIPAAFFVYLVYGIWVLRKEMEHRIEVKMEPTEAMRALALREAELKRAKEILYEELKKDQQ